MIHPPLQLLTGSFSLVRRSGILNTSVGTKLYRSAYFFYKRNMEDGLQSFLRTHPELLRGGNVLDIGSNFGYTAGLLAESIDPEYRVYAFEPEPYNFANLRETANHPRFSARIVATQAAVGAEDGTVQLWLNADHPADHRVVTTEFLPQTSARTRVEVPLVSIDRFLERDPRPVCFIKIDVQGFEQRVCEGMLHTLERNPSVTLVLEYAPSYMRSLGFEPSAVIRLLTGLGFHGGLLADNGKLIPGVPEVKEDGSYVDLFFTRQPLPA